MTFEVGQMGSSSYPAMALAGPCDAGLADPGHSAVISLMNCTMALLTHKPTSEGIISPKVLQRLVKEVGEAFIQSASGVGARRSPVWCTELKGRKLMTLTTGASGGCALRREPSDGQYPRRVQVR